jgi:predicted RNA-binding Zn-ribbon protein involved in translation (DUF1610 family)
MSETPATDSADFVVIPCVNCGAKLKLRATAVKYMKEAQCPKCYKKVPIAPEQRGEKPAAPAPPPAASAAPASAAAPAAAAPAAEAGDPSALMTRLQALEARVRVLEVTNALLKDALGKAP